MRTVLLINPVAGDGLSPKLARSVVKSLGAASDVHVVVAEDAEAVARLAAETVADGVDVLAVLGGDAATHLAVQACAGTATPLVVVPHRRGGNDLARALGMPQEPRAAASAAAEALAQRRDRRIDLGRVVGGDWFATVLCAGFAPKVNARTNRMRWPRGANRYDLAILEQLLGLRAMPLRIETETDAFDLPASLVAVGNTAWYGGGIPLCPDADPSDGQLDLTVVSPVSRRDLRRIVPKLRTGRHVDHPAVRSLRVRSVRLGGESGWCMFADGEPQVRLPLTIQGGAGQLRVITPTAPVATS